jgi:hypothetical protein
VVVEFSPPINAKERTMEEEVRPANEPDEGCAAQGPRALCSAAATVPVSKQDAEAAVLGQQQWEAVHERRARGQSLSAISRELELDRKTVRNCLQQACWQPYRRAEGSSLLDAHREWLAERAPEVNYSARILWQELRAKRAFIGSSGIHAQAGAVGPAVLLHQGARDRSALGVADRPPA